MNHACVARLRPPIGFAGTSDRLQLESVSSFAGICTEMEHFAGKRVLVHCYANARASAFVYLWRTLHAGHDDAQARAAMIEIWDLKEDYEFRNVEQWQRLVVDAQNAAPQKGQ